MGASAVASEPTACERVPSGLAAARRGSALSVALDHLCVDSLPIGTLAIEMAERNLRSSRFLETSASEVLLAV